MEPVSFSLDPRLAADTVHVCDWPLCAVLLMDDSRFPWLILVPRRNGIVEAFDLGPREQERLWREVTHAADLLKSATGCRKINIGALGNVVAQLHVHVIARNPGDAAGTAPVWGSGPAARYTAPEREKLLSRLRSFLHPPSD